MAKTLAQLLEVIHAKPRPGEIAKHWKTLYGVEAGLMTPVADNIAAALFAIAAAVQTMIDTFGEAALQKPVRMPIVPGLPISMEASVEEALILIAAALGINFGNASLWGNGVQLGENRRVITGVQSRNIGDLEVKKIPALETPGRFTFLTNPYARIADAWTAADTNAVINAIVVGITEDSAAA